MVIFTCGLLLCFSTPRGRCGLVPSISKEGHYATLWSYCTFHRLRRHRLQHVRLLFNPTRCHYQLNLIHRQQCPVGSRLRGGDRRNQKRTRSVNFFGGCSSADQVRSHFEDAMGRNASEWVAGRRNIESMSAIAAWLAAKSRSVKRQAVDWIATEGVKQVED